jgi:iron complex transport system substrate-binding protein
MRIASLLPSATEIVCALGLEDNLVAVTHECDHPPSVKGKPVVTASVLSSASSSRAVDRHIRRLLHQGSGIYTLDAERLQESRPDLILTQELCEVCAVSYPIVEHASRRLDGNVQLVSLEPESLEDVYSHIRLIGRLCGRQQASRALVSELAARVGRVEERVRDLPRRRIACLEWIDPLYCSGHWNPELVRRAGGVDLLGRPGRPAVPVKWDDLLRADPELLVVMACGFSLDRTLREMASLQEQSEWKGLPAVAAGQVYVVDGNAFFSRPGPRLVDSLEIMAGILHPEAVDPAPPGAVVRYQPP